MKSSTSNARTARELLAPLEADMTSLLSALVRTDTVSVPPGGKETAGQVVLAEFLKSYGIHAELYDTDFVRTSGHHCSRPERAYAGRKNLFASIPGSGRGRSLLFNGHMDTVPAGGGRWSESPWSGTVRDGKLYGRGSVDMKGGLAAQFAVLCALRRAGLRLGGDLFAESVVDEEWGGGGGTLAARLRGPQADACVITEATNLEVAPATRGGAIIDLICEAGDPSRYFSTEEVVSPAVPFGRLLGWVDGWTARRRNVDRGRAYRDFPDPAPVQVLAIEANRMDGEEPYRVPLSAGMRLYFQFLPHEDVDGVLAEVERSLREFCSLDPFFRGHPILWRLGFDPPLVGHELPPEHEWTRCLTACAEAALGEPVKVAAAPYPCDAFLVQREFGIPTLLFGPRGAGGHNVDEYVELASVTDTVVVLLTAALEWCGS